MLFQILLYRLFLFLFLFLFCTIKFILLITYQLFNNVVNKEMGETSQQVRSKTTPGT